MEKDFELAKKTSSQVKSHLEFLGYAVEEKDEDNGRPTLLCKSNSKPNIYAWFNKNDQHGFRIGFNKEKDLNSIEQYKYLNSKNTTLFLCKLSIDDDGSIRFQAIYTGEYGKTRFAGFIDSLLSEVSNTLSDVEFKKCFLK